MPIRESQRSRYPAEWKTISLQIRERAQQTCECTGECGSDHGFSVTNPAGRCNAPNGKMILRDPSKPERWERHSGCGACAGGEPDHKPIKVVLTVGHLNHIPEDCRPSNLRAWCQLCHNRYDLDHRKATRAETRRADKAIGELPGLEREQ